jgi:hypothetical protein
MGHGQSRKVRHDAAMEASMRAMWVMLLVVQACSSSSTGEGEGEVVGEGEGDAGEGEGEGETIPSDVAAATTAMAQILAAIPARVLACDAPLARLVDGESAALAGLREQVGTATWTAGNRYDDTAAAACLAVLTSDDCSLDDEACDRVFVANRAAGDACANNEQCAEGVCNLDGACGACAAPTALCTAPEDCAVGLYCNFSTSSCTPPGATGSPCSFDAACADNGVCVIDDEGDGSCVAPAADGSSCAVTPCARTSRCSFNNVCRPLAAEGDACSGECAAGLQCIDGTCLVYVQGNVVADPCTAADIQSCGGSQRGLFCAVTGLCEQVAVVAIGQACDDTTAFCAGSIFGGVSSCASGTCVATAANGEGCGQAFEGMLPCDLSGFCVDNFCQPRGDENAACTSSEGCRQGTNCIDNVCQIPLGLDESCATGPCAVGRCINDRCYLVPGEDSCPL